MRTNNFQKSSKGAVSDDFSGRINGFKGDEKFYIAYCESLTEGDLRPILLDDFNAEEAGGENELF